MPITVTAAKGVITPERESQLVPRLTDALLEATGAVGNDFLTSITGGTLHLLEPEQVYAGGVNQPLVMIELKLPHVALSSPETRASFIEGATDVVDSLSVEGHPRENIWVNVLHVPDGGWGIGGRAYTGDDLLAAAAASGGDQ